MSAIEIAVTYSKQLESLLTEDLNAEGKGLHEKLTSVESILEPALIKQIRWIATMRNKVVHEADFTIDDPAGFEHSCEKAILELKLQILSHKKTQEDKKKSSLSAFQPHTTAKEKGPIVNAVPIKKSANDVTEEKPSMGTGKFFLFLFIIVFASFAVSHYNDEVKKEEEKIRIEKYKKQAALKKEKEAKIKAQKAEKYRREQKEIRARNLALHNEMKKATEKKDKAKAKNIQKSSGTKETPSLNKGKISLKKGQLSSLASQSTVDYQSAKNNINENILTVVKDKTKITLGKTIVRDNGNGTADIIMDVRWNTPEKEVLTTLNKYFYGYKRKALKAGSVKLQGSFGKSSHGVIVRRYNNKDSDQKLVISSKIYDYLAKHSINIKVDASGYSEVITIAQGKGGKKTKDSFNMHLSGGPRKDNLIIGEQQNPIVIKNVPLNKLDSINKITASIIVSGDFNGKKVQSTIKLKSEQLSFAQQDSKSSIKKAKLDIEKNIIDNIKNKTKVTLGDPKVKENGKSSDLIIPIAWRMSHQEILKSLNRYFYQYNRKPFTYGKIKFSSFANDSVFGVIVREYSNKREEQKTPFTNLLYKYLASKEIYILVRAGKYTQRITLADHSSKKDKFTIQFQANFNNDTLINYKESNPIVFKDIPNNELNKINDISYKIIVK